MPTGQTQLAICFCRSGLMGTPPPHSFLSPWSAAALARHCRTEQWQQRLLPHKASPSLYRKPIPALLACLFRTCTSFWPKPNSILDIDTGNGTRKKAAKQSGFIPCCDIRFFHSLHMREASRPFSTSTINTLSYWEALCQASEDCGILSTARGAAQLGQVNITVRHRRRGPERI